MVVVGSSPDSSSPVGKSGWIKPGWIKPSRIKPGWIKHGLEKCFGKAQVAPEIIHREVTVRQQF